VDIWRKLGEYGGIMLISGINPQLNRIFKITNLDKIFEFYPDRAGAIKAIKDKEL
jgi:anti-anti-sigma regulatory factor